MKAKEIAAKIIAVPDNGDDVLSAICTESMHLAAEAMSNAAKRASDASKVACLREGYTKWKSVVVQVNEAVDESPIDNNFYPKALALMSPPVFALCLREKVFLGYTPDARDLQKASEGIAQVEAEVQADRVKSMMKQARSMGMDPQVIANQARAMGIKID
jgi:hypothetical protein